MPVKEADRLAGPYPYYGASGVIDWVNDYLLDGQYLLIAEDGENLRTRKTPVAFLTSGQFWVNNHVHVVRGRNGLADTRYLNYAMCSIHIGAYLTGSTQPKLTQNNLNQILVPAPPIAVQCAIAEVLGVLDDKIALNRRMNETLDALARTLFDQSFREDRSATVADIVSFSRAAIAPIGFPDEVFDHYSIPAFDDGSTPADSSGSEIMSSKFVVPRDAVLLSKLNPRFPRVWLPDLSTERRSICSTEFLVAVPRAPFTREYVYCLMRSQRFQDVLAGLVTGTSGSHQRVKPNDVLAIEAPMPTPMAIEAFTSTTRSLLDRVALNRRESTTLAELRDTLLPKLISGEIRVRDAEEAVETTG